MDYEIRRRTVVKSCRRLCTPCMPCTYPGEARYYETWQQRVLAERNARRLKNHGCWGPPPPLAADGEDWDGTSRGMTGPRIDGDDDFDFCNRVFISKRLIDLALGGVVRSQDKKYGTFDQEVCTSCWSALRRYLRSWRNPSTKYTYRMYIVQRPAGHNQVEPGDFWRTPPDEVADPSFLLC